MEPEFALAVATIESRLQVDLETPRFVGLFCLDKARVRERFGLTPAEAKDPFVNITVGVASLRGRDKERVLRRFNPEDPGGVYRRQVLRYYRQLRREKKGRARLK
ncbi:MAG: hypothetical protein ACYDHF_06295 [Candidatus Cryosericum sp.]